MRRTNFNEEDISEAIVCEASWCQVLQSFGNCGHHPLGKYGPDLLFISKERACFIEVECRSGWFSDHYPWNTLDVLPRRVETAKKYSPIPSIFLQSNRDYSSAALCLVEDWDHSGGDVEVEDFVFIRRDCLDLEAIFYLVDKAQEN